MRVKMRRKIQHARKAGATFDWAQARERMQATLTTLDTANALTPEALQAIWERRAAQLAQVPQATDEGAQIDLVVVRLGRECYALEVQYVFRIRPAAQLTKIPRVPEWIAGVTNERGRVLSVFDVRRFLGLPEATAEQAAQPYFVIVETPEMELALLADAVLNIITVPVKSIENDGEAVRGIPIEYVRGVLHAATAFTTNGDTQPTLVVLALQSLLADERLCVRQEVG